MSAPQTANAKLLQYRSLVADRKKCSLCSSLEMSNPSGVEGGKYDTDHIGPWTQWQDDLDAEIMVVGQDWGGRDYFVDEEGIEADDNITNTNLQILLASVGYDIALPAEPQKPARLFFTNAVLCLKPGRLTGPVKAECFQNCGINFLKPQIELVQPKVVITLGLEPYKAVMGAYNRRPETSMPKAIQTTEVLGQITLVPVYHCGYYGTLARSIEEQKRDWQRVAAILNGTD